MSRDVLTRDVAVSARGIWKCFRHGQEYVTVLEDLDLEVRRGEFVCLVGPSGCGKSTLLSILAGLEPATLGSVETEGSADTDREPVKSAFVFQRDLLLDWRTVLDNVLVGYLLRGESPRPHRDRALELLHQVGLRGTADLHPWQLSGGMRQRVAICRALIDDPDVLFMDEPFGALDALTRERLNDDLIALGGAGEGGKTIVFVTHDVSEAVFLGDRVVVMGARPGRIADDIAVHLPVRGPELRNSPEFFEIAARVRAALHLQDDVAQAERLEMDA